MLAKVVKLNPINLGLIVAVMTVIISVINLGSIFFFYDMILSQLQELGKNNVQVKQLLSQSKELSVVGLSISLFLNTLVTTILSFIVGIIEGAIYNFCASSSLGGQLGLNLSQNPLNNKTVYVDSLDTGSLVRIYAFIMGLLSFIPAVFICIVNLMAAKYALAAGLLVGIPIGAIIGASIAAVILAALYNLTAKFTKGIMLKVEMDDKEDGQIVYTGIWQMVKFGSFIYFVFSVIGVLIYSAISTMANQFQVGFLAVPFIVLFAGAIGIFFAGLMINLALKLTGGLDITFGGLPVDDGGGENQTDNGEENKTQEGESA
jgi:hypothetical protein